MASRDTQTTDSLRAIKMERTDVLPPHHIVSQQGPEAMKHRIVVDGSVKLTCWESCFDSGVFEWPFNLTSQVGLHEEDRDVCRFLWKNSGPGGTLATYRLTRVCFGLVCSPYLSMQVAGMYVDDLVVSCHTIAEAKDFVCRSPELLSSGGFCLAKWASSAPEALADERLIDELTYDKRFELRSWLLQWAVPSSHAAIRRISFMHEQDTWIVVKT
ncbi:hypothetical protein T01_14687 [Trichinella spiralis]|uniref:Uncharacterized protein n=1 Tax=Trichinella spiralis TaxID=6334 RepID=A0A0V1BE15_TRISP|nr:hypothetical protein T01_14687 [Trichinella spiralis]